MFNGNYILGIGGLLGHDANVTLFRDADLIYSSQEERFSKCKHDPRFPYNAINDCLSFAGIVARDIAVVVFAEKPLQSHLFDISNKRANFLSKIMGYHLSDTIYSGSLYISLAKNLFPNAKIKYAWHHLSHAAAGYHTSPFDRATFLCVDGKGEEINASIGVVTTDDIRIIYELPYDNGLGMLYTLITNFLGFSSHGSEYKIMGLAPYGKDRYSELLKRLYVTSSKGETRIRRPIKFNKNDIVENFKWVEKELGIRHRESQDKLSSEHVDLAASLQAIFEQEIMKMAKFAKDVTGENNIIFCGGAAQNCVAAGKLRDSGIFQNVFNSPVGGDMGSSLGAALLHLRKVKKISSQKLVDKGFYLGSLPGYFQNNDPDPYTISYTGSLHSFVANLLAEGKIIGWVRGRMELGSRALGARSILANPQELDMQTKLNLKIKFRESFRPFAPAILEEEQEKWFESKKPSYYMQFTSFLRKELRYTVPEKFVSYKDQLNYPRCKVPSTVHVDFSARLQTISRHIHPDLHELISEFFKLTGVPILINTSFNVNGQPIVRTADDAWDCFINTEIDFLVVNDQIFRNPFNKTREEKLLWLKQFEIFSN